MKFTIGLILLLPLYLVLHLTSLLARSMAVISAVTAQSIISIIFWTSSPSLMSWAERQFGTFEMKEEK